MRRFGRILALLALPLAGGCASAGGAATGAIGGLFQMAMYLAMLVGPLYLSYYLYGKDD